MSASKRPSTSSLRRFITSRPYVTVAELRRRFSLDDPDAMTHVRRNGTSAWIGLPEREATKLEDLWHREEVGLELSVEVRAPVVVGVYPIRIARYVMDGTGMNGAVNQGARGNGNGTERGEPIGHTDPAGHADPAVPPRPGVTHPSDSGNHHQVRAHHSP